MVQGKRFTGRQLGAVVFLLGVASLGCAPSISSEVGASAAPVAWSGVRCNACESAGLVVEARRTVDEAGQPGRYTHTRIRNLKPQGVIFNAEFIMAQRAFDDELLVESRTVDLGPEGESVMLFRHRGVAEVVVRQVERLAAGTP